MQAINDTHILGIDVSHHQPTMPWKDLKAEGVEFVYIKASEGVTYDDPKMMDHYNGAKAAGLKVGFYHYARPYNDPVKEVENLLDDTKHLQRDLPYVLDIETDEGDRFGREYIASFAFDFITELEARTGEKPILYTYTSFAKENLDKRVAKWPVWIAHYGVKKPGANGIWKEWLIFQYTSDGGLKSYKGRLDLNRAERSLLMAERKIFNDVSESHYFAADIEWASRNKLIAGDTDGNFKPDEPVTRAQLAAILRRALQK